MSSPPIGLPSDIANSLQYLEDTDLHRLRAAVEAEIARRKEGASTGKHKAAAPPASRPVSSAVRAAKMAEIPEGRANLVRASFEAGLKPPTIARTFGVSVSQVNRIIRSAEKSNAR
jgi:DNA invertase Pin-like site-specific DNA recombinase